MSFHVGAESVDQLMRDAEIAFTRADLVDAMSLYRQAAELGHSPAQIRLAQLLDTAEENEKAYHWYTVAAEQGDPAGQFGLAQLLSLGEGVPEDPEQANVWFERAAAQNYAPAIRVLALAYEQGGMGQRVDYDTAVKWLEVGASAGDDWSKKRLSRAYRYGELGLRINRQAADKLDATESSP